MRQGPLRAGDAVRIRGERWRVAAQRPFESVAIIDVDGCDATNHGTRASFILPFERVDHLAVRPSAPRIVTPVRWRRTARAVLAAATPRWTSLRAAAQARLTILPFQLEPALAVVRGDASRVLIADEVGLGKTIQAGLIVAETIARAPDARVLIVSPAGLREQWRSELQARFGLAAAVLDAEGVARTSARLVPDVNPWAVHPVAITSIDYVKRPEVMRALEPLTWDVVVFDEAHALAGRSDRATAASLLGRRARTAVMLTATPHSGDEEAFARLCSLGDLYDSFPLLTFRRTRLDVGLPHGRKLTSLRVRPTCSEEAMHRALARYVERLAEEGRSSPGSLLVGAILMRRACSSALSLARSLERRRALLTDATPPPTDQLTLPFFDGDSDEEPGNELGCAGLRDQSEEARWLEQLRDLALAAAASESKIDALRALIRRARQPLLVFTEYRDTLQHLAATLDAFAPLQLHGGLNARERAGVLRQFTSGSAQLLLATDAASEGLNLHYRCRLVVNLELPWTPLRLEQRIGRVDRLGQPRRVHAVQLIARDTCEEAMAARLDDRAGRIHIALPAGGEGPLREEAAFEAARLLISKALAPQSLAQIGAPVVTVLKAGAACNAALWAFHFACVDSSGHVIFETTTGVRDERGRLAPDAHVDRCAAAQHRAALAETRALIQRWVDLAAHRERALVDALHESHGRLSAALLQPGLFDRRAERAAAAQAARLEEALVRSEARQTMLSRWRDVRMDERSIAFGVLYRP